MRISAHLTDSAVLKELGSRLRSARLERNLSQAALAEAAGVGRVTLQRLEEGATGSSLPSLIKVLRALNLSGGLDSLVPEPVPSPIEEVRRGARQRKRAGPPRRAADNSTPPRWRWGDEGPS